MEKKPRREDTNIDKKLKRLKEQLFMELGTRDNSALLLLTLLPFVKQIQ